MSDTVTVVRGKKHYHDVLTLDTQTVNVRSLDNDFKRFFTVDTNGRFEIKVPPGNIKSV